MAASERSVNCWDNELCAATRALRKAANRLEHAQARSRCEPGERRTADLASPGPAASGWLPARSTVSVLADGYLEIEALLLESQRREDDPTEARRLRARAARVLRDRIGLVLTDPETAGLVANVRPELLSPVEMAAAEGRFLGVESDLLHLAGLPRVEARVLVDEGWAVHQLRPVRGVSGEQLMDRLATLHADLSAPEDGMDALLDQPDPIVADPPAGAAPTRRAWWRRTPGRRLLWIAGGVLVTVANVAAAGTLAAATAGAGAALVGVSANVGTSLVFQGVAQQP